MGIPYAEVIGDPIAHSKSPLIHKFWLAKLGLEGDFRAVRVTPDEFDSYLESRRRDPDWRGCNVSMPLKEIAFQRAVPDPVTRRIGALNTLIEYGDGPIMGANTDWIAFNLALGTYRLNPQRPAVIGTGGAARAAMAELQLSKVPSVTLISRSKERAAQMLADFQMSGDILPPGSAPEADLLINATPMGMNGFPSNDVDLANLAPDASVVELVYHPLETELLRRARGKGLRTIDGLDMLIWQASMAFTYFFKDSPDEDHEELRELLTR